MQNDGFSPLGRKGTGRSGGEEEVVVAEGFVAVDGGGSSST